MGVSAGISLRMESSAAFVTFVEELTSALAARGIRFEPGTNGRMMECGQEIARVVSWRPGYSIILEWLAPEWSKSGATKVEVRFEPDKEGTRITLDHAEWGNLFDDRGGELAGWFASEVAAPLLQDVAPSRFGDWITDRRARRPSGANARATYRNPVYHRPNFLAILNILQLGPADYLIEVGCGGGAFLRDALQSGCKAAAVDHSPEMVTLAGEVNLQAMAEDRLVIREAEADMLPYPDEMFTCAVMTGVFSFLPNPLAALCEMHRVLKKDGRLVVYMGSKELRGTPAAPEPIASRLRFYEDHELEELSREAGFNTVRVERPNLEEFARQANVPPQDIHLFSGRASQLLIARKS